MSDVVDANSLVPCLGHGARCERRGHVLYYSVRICTDLDATREQGHIPTCIPRGYSASTSMDLENSRCFQRINAALHGCGVYVAPAACGPERETCVQVDHQRPCPFSTSYKPPVWLTIVTGGEFSLLVVPSVNHAPFARPGG